MNLGNNLCNCHLLLAHYHFLCVPFHCQIDDYQWGKIGDGCLVNGWRVEQSCQARDGWIIINSGLQVLDLNDLTRATDDC